MLHNNGRINLDQEIKKAIDLGENVKITKANGTSHPAYWIQNFHQKNYLFKETDTNEKYRSLIVQKMANQVGIEFPNTTLATMYQKDGELIEDYRKKDYEYLSGTTILLEYYYFGSINKIDSFLTTNCFGSEDVFLQKMNNLETIWKALDFHFKKFEDKNEIVYHIMKQMAYRFSLDFLTMQRDRMDFNWEIEEAIDHSSAKLAPMFDNDKSFYLPSFSVKQDSGENQKVSDVYEKLEYFLTYSSRDFIDFFYHLIETFTPDKLTQIIEEIERENHFEMEQMIKIEIIASYKEHYEILQKIIKKLEENKLRR